ncbi:unnamed protein product [Amoebophrya sp. A120]|nr:unnamed protein product [Amoebophrya sp. A120]|eukprot:GSA120T00014168001.1
MERRLALLDEFCDRSEALVFNQDVAAPGPRASDNSEDSNSSDGDDRDSADHHDEKQQLLSSPACGGSREEMNITTGKDKKNKAKTTSSSSKKDSPARLLFWSIGVLTDSKTVEWSLFSLLVDRLERKLKQLKAFGPPAEKVAAAEVGGGVGGSSSSSSSSSGSSNRTSRIGSKEQLPSSTGDEAEDLYAEEQRIMEKLEKVRKLKRELLAKMKQRDVFRDVKTLFNCVYMHLLVLLDEESSGTIPSTEIIARQTSRVNDEDDKHATATLLHKSIRQLFDFLLQIWTDTAKYPMLPLRKICLATTKVLEVMERGIRLSRITSMAGDQRTSPPAIGVQVGTSSSSSSSFYRDENRKDTATGEDHVTNNSGPRNFFYQQEQYDFQSLQALLTHEQKLKEKYPSGSKPPKAIREALEIIERQKAQHLNIEQNGVCSRKFNCKTDGAGDRACNSSLSGAGMPTEKNNVKLSSYQIGLLLQNPVTRQSLLEQECSQKQLVSSANRHRAGTALDGNGRHEDYTGFTPAAAGAQSSSVQRPDTNPALILLQSFGPTDQLSDFCIFLLRLLLTSCQSSSTATFSAGVDLMQELNFDKDYEGTRNKTADDKKLGSSTNGSSFSANNLSTSPIKEAKEKQQKEIVASACARLLFFLLDKLENDAFAFFSKAMFDSNGILVLLKYLNQDFLSAFNNNSSGAGAIGPPGTSSGFNSMSGLINANNSSRTSSGGVFLPTPGQTNHGSCSFENPFIADIFEMEMKFSTAAAASRTNKEAFFSDRTETETTSEDEEEETTASGAEEVEAKAKSQPVVWEDDNTESEFFSTTAALFIEDDQVVQQDENKEGTKTTKKRKKKSGSKPVSALSKNNSSYDGLYLSPPNWSNFAAEYHKTRPIQTCKCLLDVLYLLCVDEPERVKKVLIHYKAPFILKRFNNHSLTKQPYLKLMKLQCRVLPRKWKSQNMTICSDIYLNHDGMMNPMAAHQELPGGSSSHAGPQGAGSTGTLFFNRQNKLEPPLVEDFLFEVPEDDSFGGSDGDITASYNRDLLELPLYFLGKHRGFGIEKAVADYYRMDFQVGSDAAASALGGTASGGSCADVEFEISTGDEDLDEIKFSGGDTTAFEDDKPTTICQEFQRILDTNTTQSFLAIDVQEKLCAFSAADRVVPVKNTEEDDIPRDDAADDNDDDDEAPLTAENEAALRYFSENFLPPCGYSDMFSEEDLRRLTTMRSIEDFCEDVEDACLTKKNPSFVTTTSSICSSKTTSPAQDSESEYVNLKSFYANEIEDLLDAHELDDVFISDEKDAADDFFFPDDADFVHVL